MAKKPTYAQIDDNVDEDLAALNTPAVIHWPHPWPEAWGDPSASAPDAVSRSKQVEVYPETEEIGVD